jgi:hypothetical protein
VVALFWGRHEACPYVIPANAGIQSRLGGIQSRGTRDWTPSRGTRDSPG